MIDNMSALETKQIVMQNSLCVIVQADYNRIFANMKV